MRDCTIYLKRIMDTYLKVTETGSYCFDIRLNLILSNTDYITVNELSTLGFNKVLSFLAETFSNTVSDKRYFAFFLHNNIICHIVFIIRNNNYIGAIVSEPIMVKALSDTEFNELASNLQIAEHKKSEIHKFLSRKKTIGYDKAMACGTVLYSLSFSLIKENAATQILKSYQNTTKKIVKSSFSENHTWNVKGIERHIPSSTYLSLKQAIQEGDTPKLLNLINQQGASFAPMQQLHSTDHIRSIKNSFIKLCSMVCYTAIDAGAPYVQTLDTTDDMILKMELTDNVTEIYEMMRNVLTTLTKAVSDSKKSIYSQPVRKILDYLYSHYSEKVTLEDLSNITRLSTYYISNLIKSETGMSLNDNINNIRIEQSKKLLLEKNSSILEVAQSVGFHYQNHFAAVFKRYCGISPSDYRNAHGVSFVGMTSMTEAATNKLLSQIIFQIKSKLTIFDGLYDTARIVDPIEHTSWMIYGEEAPETKATCFHFWNNNESCQNCISIRAYVQNDTFFKLEQKEKQTYLVLAFPEYIGKSVYITELLKDISSQSIINITANITNPLLDTADKFKDMQTGFYTRYYIDKHLPIDIRKAKAEQKSLALIAIVFTLPEQTNGIYEFLPLLSESALSCLPGPEDWIGHYAGNILLFVLHGKAEEQMQEINHNIQTTLKGKLNSIGFSDIDIQTADQHLSQEVFEAGELFYLLFAKLYAKAQSDT